MFSRRIWVMLVVALAVAASSYSQAPQFAEQLTVVDANGKRVGRVMGVEYLSNSGYPVTPVVALKVNQLSLMLLVSRSGFASFHSSSDVYWESTDCSGPAYLAHWADDSLLTNVVVGYPGQTVYVPEGEPRGIQARSHSRRDPGHPTASICTPGSSSSGMAVPAKALIDLNTQFTAPYSLR